MRTKVHVLLCFSLLLRAVSAEAVPKPHVITFGKWTSVKWFAGPAENTPVDLRVRALYVDARLKEYTTGTPHDVTDRLFVVQRVSRFNDNLPDEIGPAFRWQWQRGGWLLVDRVTGRVAPIPLAEFDPLYSTATWYRDYIAYCGISDDGKRLFAVVGQLGHRKPILKRSLGEPAGKDVPDSACSAPTWQRQPTRVTFKQGEGPSLTFAVRGRSVDVVNDEDEEVASK
jgi:hypothetical protein